jgi:hypothetical protein
MKLKIKFILSKGDGALPDIGLLPLEKRNKDYIHSCMNFMPAFEDVEDIIENWNFIDQGLVNNLKTKTNFCKVYGKVAIDFQ